MIFAAMITLCSCNKDDKNFTPVGDWEAMIVSVENATFDASSKEDKVINVPSEGNHFTLKVTNYDDWWIQSINVKEISANKYKAIKVRDNRYITSDWIGVEVISNQAKCNISANTSTIPRIIKLEMTAGDVFETIDIVQAGK